MERQKANYFQSPIYRKFGQLNYRRAMLLPYKPAVGKLFDLVALIFYSGIQTALIDVSVSRVARYLSRRARTCMCRQTKRSASIMGREA